MNLTLVCFKESLYKTNINVFSPSFLTVILFSVILDWEKSIISFGLTIYLISCSLSDLYSFLKLINLEIIWYDPFSFAIKSST
ncbi:hypothetical protein [Mycoplasmopsis felis]|uniref:hypothetical protein n=1 Tax=Mycoplasmopsis felis TaxID=33923 RepID=UPI0021AE879E|nr:hypothetical protein [Mycoplasmopsis felis]MCU9937718.1 hypothetical protein [Mycoplasmopsis felis]UWV84001.1 hypothetical protein NWE58_00405 [Mycoplasmopsis felis]UWW00616.1 hypothetical protein NW064_05320 [Mycoplasmopsis felis]WAM02550.1 hypothetical protein ONA02_01705 [Mycoplasmopsis felis]